MSNPQQRKGDKAAREAAELLTEVTGFKCQRNLSAGIPGDVGDIYGIPNCVVQICDWKDKSKACLGDSWFRHEITDEQYCLRIKQLDQRIADLQG